jgi:hypothetical protein
VPLAARSRHPEFPMHFPLTEADVIWILTFAALLVLLVVLLGRDRVRRFPFFTAGVVLAALEMLARRLLADKLPPLASTELSLAMADAGAAIALLVAIELARRAFAGASARAWIVGVVAVPAVAAGILIRWGPWPPRQTVFASSLMDHLRLMQLAAEKGDLFSNLLFIGLALLAIFTGRRLHAGWRSQARQLLLGYSVAGLAQVAVRVVWERLARAGPPTSEADFDHRMVVQNHLLEANSFIFLAVIVGWIVCLWFDDPGNKPAAELALPAEAAPLEEGASPASQKEDNADTVAAAGKRAIGSGNGVPRNRQ